MDKTETYKYEKTAGLANAFKPLANELREKHNTKFELSVHYDCLLISGSSELAKAINDIRDDIIKYAKDNLDEVYKIILPHPAYTSFSPHINTNSTRTYSLSRILKENEPK